MLCISYGEKMSVVSMVKKGLRIWLLLPFPVPLRSCCSPSWCGSGPQCPWGGGDNGAVLANQGPPRLLPTWKGKGRTCDHAELSSSSTIHMSLLGERDAPFAPSGHQAMKTWEGGITFLWPKTQDLQPELEGMMPGSTKLRGPRGGGQIPSPAHPRAEILL